MIASIWHHVIHKFLSNYMKKQISFYECFVLEKYYVLGKLQIEM